MIIGLIGFQGSGKGTVADYLIKEKGFKEDSFAATLKDAAAVIFGWNREMLEGKSDESRVWREQPDRFWSDSLGYELTPRMALQRLGTEAGQGTFGKRIWVSGVMKRIQNLDKVVISDARFSHEVSAIKDAGGILIRIKRGPDPEWIESLKHIYTDREREDYMRQFKVHKSEWDWVGYGYDYLICNDGGLTDLYDQVYNILAKELV